MIAERSSSCRAGSGTKSVTLFRCCYLFCYAEAQGFLRHCGLRNDFQRCASRDVCTPDWQHRILCYVVTFDEKLGKIQTKSGAWVGNRSRNNAGTGGYTSAFGGRRGSVVLEREAMLNRRMRKPLRTLWGTPNLRRSHSADHPGKALCGPPMQPEGHGSSAGLSAARAFRAAGSRERVRIFYRDC